MLSLTDPSAALSPCAFAPAVVVVVAAVAVAVAWCLAAGALAIAARAYQRRFRFSLSSSFPRELASRGFGAAAAAGGGSASASAPAAPPLPYYPYRDDGALVWASLRRYCRAALVGGRLSTSGDTVPGAYPDGDLFVTRARDPALAAFFDELVASAGGGRDSSGEDPLANDGEREKDDSDGSDDSGGGVGGGGGRLHGVHVPSTVEGLAEFAAAAVWGATARASAVRQGHFDALALASLRPLALRTPPLPPGSAEHGLQPSGGTGASSSALQQAEAAHAAEHADAEARLLRALPPPREAMAAAAAARRLSRAVSRTLLDAHSDTFVFGDPRHPVHDFAFAPQYRELISDLQSAAQLIEKRNSLRARAADGSGSGAGCGPPCTYGRLLPSHVAAAGTGSY